MRNDQDFNIQFVLVVEQFEELYNYNLTTYSNRQSQEKAWQSVADQFKSTAAECKKRWRMLRVTFLRCLREKKKPSGSSGKKKKPHYLEDAMKFLIPFTKSRCQTGNVESGDETESCSQIYDAEISTNDENDGMHNSDDGQNTQDEHEEIMDTTMIEEREAQSLPTKELPSKSTDRDAATSFQISKKKLKTKQLSTESWEHAAVQCLNDLSTKYKSKVNERSDEEDSDLLFLKSLLPDMKKLSDAQKRRYKQRMLALYDEVLSEQPIPAYSPAMSNYSSLSSSSHSYFNGARNQGRNLHQREEDFPSYTTLVSATVTNEHQ